jgi:hypothetical protein
MLLKEMNFLLIREKLMYCFQKFQLDSDGPERFLKCWFQFTILGAYRDQTKFVLNTIPHDTAYQRTATTDVYLEIDYWAVRFSGKFGISAEWEKFKLGLHLQRRFGNKVVKRGTDGASVTSNNVYVTIDSSTNQVTPLDRLATDRQEGLPVSYRTPLSLAAGVEYTLSEETKIHFAAEWFAPLSAYVVMQPESDNFLRNDPQDVRPINSAIILRVYDAMALLISVLLLSIS